VAPTRLWTKTDVVKSNLTCMLHPAELYDQAPSAVKGASEKC
jgi:hypothetical protein